MMRIPTSLLPRVERLVHARAEEHFETEDEARARVHAAIIQEGIAALEGRAREDPQT